MVTLSIATGQKVRYLSKGGNIMNVYEFDISKPVSYRLTGILWT